MAFGAILGQTPTPDIPVGAIILWSGTTSDIPTNWHLCDGTNGTPDLRGQFVIGAGGSYSVGNTGGEETHTLTLSEMPKHSHVLANYGNGRPIYASNVSGNGSFWGIYVDYYGGSGPSVETDSVGSSQPHNNLPPYYALCYIMKIA